MSDSLRDCLAASLLRMVSVLLLDDLPFAQVNNYRRDVNLEELLEVRKGNGFHP